MAVDYIDRRNNSDVVVYYTDEDSNGHPDEVSYGGNDGKTRITFVVSKNERLTEKANFDRFRNGAIYTMVGAPKVSFWIKSSEGQNLDLNYRDVVLSYKKLHPDIKLPENELQLEPVRLDIVENFGKWVDEYLARKQDPNMSKTNRDGEIANYREYLAEGYLASAYEQLNDRERDALFDWDFELLDTALQIGRRVATVLMWDKKTWSYWPRNPRREFEEWIHEPQEIDYMSAWSISIEFDKQKATYNAELQKRGLTL